MRPEDEIHYPHLPLPATGTVTPVAPGIQWVRMPLPFALDHINLWMIRDLIDGQAGWTLIDTGICNPETKTAWAHVFEHHLEGLPVLRVLCTHFHPDHVGLAHWICEGADTGKWEAPLWMTFAEYAAARIGSVPDQADDTHRANDLTKMASYFHEHGIQDEATLATLRGRKNYYSSMVPRVPQSFRRIFPGEQIRIGGQKWKVIAGYGHCPEHASLFCESLKVLISGDMLLPKISTNMSVWSQEPDANPLQLYLDSLTRFEDLPHHVLVLPSHGKPFSDAPQGAQSAGSVEPAGGLHTRVRQLREHHRARLEEAFNACDRPVTAADVLPVLFKRALDTHQLTFALGETIAHLNYLWHAGDIARERAVEPAGHVVYRFCQR